MSLKRALILLSLVLVVAMLGACVRSASTPPVSIVTPPTPAEGVEGAPLEPTQAEAGAAPGQEGAAVETPQEGVKGQPVATNEVLMQLEQFVTQTAAAAQLAAGQQPGSQQPGAGQPGGESQQATPYPVEGVSPGGSAQPTAAQPGAIPPTSGEQAGSAQPTSQPAGSSQPGSVQPTTPSSAPGQPVPVPTQPQAPAQSAPPQAGSIPVPTVTPGIPSSYTLQAGEFVYCIARRFNVNPLELLSINGLTTSTVVRGGTVLKIPQTGHPFPGERSLKAHPTTYIVQGSESIYEIACSFGSVSPDMIALVNGLKSPYTLRSGQELYIP